ncbi:ubiquinone/menaquinone biosynthesis C-methylase UbiE [Thermosporothrix hazakensis]|jgi:ubiquinone/menaquinone biosynthesis C-methylase UbiE|uniref:Ubiquinone/menaquinone biosynthesis C-methylase UbiE n=2 Tax=Thermosporothrix TaxID=768650 RepID=A0A326U0Q0_THEHA|nr:class I SAM-dependent methyltransferase [Thermosporothrix hazakensis]PZW22913.1 ubiquinone/menaquinone biosynthesis C-methylase UbiE [Thermosporothrix hazakensis]BBH89810.1 hypothetical protein KTC_45610 [Thermosporothrix sp. COM3]GCE47998.1 hypothetical protein KTH_28670 [Thermosporothrix hazakensis]
MFTASDITQYGKVAIIDRDNPVEMTRQTLQNKLINTYLLHAAENTSMLLPTTGRILDIPCGGGACTLDMAFAYPDFDVIGIDSHKRQIDYAHAQVQDLDNIDFVQMDIREGLDFPDAYFCLVHMRFLASFVQDEEWPFVLSECHRVLQNDSFICMIECDPCRTSSPALEQLSAYYAETLQKKGLRCTPVGTPHQLGKPLDIASLLQESGFTILSQTVYPLNFSVGTAAHNGMLQNIAAFLQLIQPFLTKNGTVSQTRFDNLYQQALQEMVATTFTGQWDIRVVTGQKKASFAQAACSCETQPSREPSPL